MEIALTISVAIGLTVGLTEVVKQTFNLQNRRLIPLISLLFGIGVAYFFNLPTNEWILTGVVVGLSASGLWSSAKAVKNG